MRWTPKNISIGMLAVAAAILTAVTTMDPVDTNPDEFGQIGSGISVDPSRDNSATDDPPVPSTTPPVITLGDLDPPPDLCTLIGWTDLPSETRSVAHTGPNATTTRFGVQRVDTHQHGRPLCIGLTSAASGGAQPTATRLSTKDARAALLTVINTTR